MRALILASVLTTAAHAEPRRVLRVCADPNNFPLSSERRAGFENELASLIARDLGARVETTWWAQRRGFFRHTLSAGTCDVVMGVPVGLGMVRTTAPYVKSAYVIVTRGLDIHSLDDDRLRTLRIGVQLVGDDGAASPPIHALAERGIIDNVVGYNVLGDYAQDGPPAAVMRALEAGDVDVALVWGPLAGAYASKSKTKLTIVPLRDMAFAMALGVRKQDRALAAELDGVLARQHGRIAKLLARWRIPVVP
jgi:mxaJ protein